MFAALTSWKPALGYIYKDKVNFLLTALPIMIGIFLYYFAGSWVYETVIGYGESLINQYIGDSAWGTAATYIVSILMTVLLFFVVNYTFVLVVSLLCAPFNDLLSQRIEKKILGHTQLSLGDSMQSVWRKFLTTMFNEIKKITFIISLSLVAFLFSYIPFFMPFGLMLAALVLSIEFLDYSWSRHNLSFSNCVNEIKSNIITYVIGGGFVMVLVTVPLLNVIVPPLATSYFTTIWVKKNASGDQITKRSV